MNAATANDLPLLPPPAAVDSRCWAPASPVASAGGGRMHVWLDARSFFTRDSAQQFCWLWLCGADGRVHALRVPATRWGDDHLARSLLAHFSAEQDLPIPAARAFGPALPLPAAPIVPLPRWQVSWGHPLQRSLRAFAAQLNPEVLTALGALEVPGPFFGSVSNYNRLATLADTIRRHRLQALAEFPPLTAPLLLDVYGRPDMFGTDEDEPIHSAQCERGAGTAVLEAIDRGRDLIGALAAYYGISRALVRSPMMREPWVQGCVPSDVLHLLEALPAHARPKERADVEDRLPLLRALPLRPRGSVEIACLASVFARGWNEAWRSFDGQARGPLESQLRDTRDFLRALLEQPRVADLEVRLDMDRLCLAWVARRGLQSLLEASLRWHAQPLVKQETNDGLPETIVAIWGDADTGGRFELKNWGSAREILSRADLVQEGWTMHHCVGGYWLQCVLKGIRIVHLSLVGGEIATAQYRLHGPPDNPVLAQEQLRGPFNAEPSEAMQGLSQMTLVALNCAAVRSRRVWAMQAMEETRGQYRPRAPRVFQRPLDRRSHQELRMVLEWCCRQAEWCTQATVLLRASIRGFGHAMGPQVFPQLAPGQALQLVREPGNPYDSLAVRIDWRGRKLGYVPRDDNADIARRLDEGEALVASIGSVAQQATARDAVEFKIMTASPDNKLGIN